MHISLSKSLKSLTLKKKKILLITLHPRPASAFFYQEWNPIGVWMIPLPPTELQAQVFSGILLFFFFFFAEGVAFFFLFLYFFLLLSGTMGQAHQVRSTVIKVAQTPTLSLQSKGLHYTFLDEPSTFEVEKMSYHMFHFYQRNGVFKF